MDLLLGGVVVTDTCFLRKVLARSFQATGDIWVHLTPRLFANRQMSLIEIGLICALQQEDIGLDNPRERDQQSESQEKDLVEEAGYGRCEEGVTV